MGGAARKIGLLIWKNLLLRKRHWLVTALEIILPTLLALGVAFLFTKIGQPPPGSRGGQGQRPQKVKENATVFPPFNSSELEVRCELGKPPKRCFVAYTPDSPFVKGVLDEVQKGLHNSTQQNMEWKAFSSEAEIEKRVTGWGLRRLQEKEFEASGEAILKAAIVFDKGMSGEKEGPIGYKVRMVIEADPKGEPSLFQDEVMDALFPSKAGQGPSLENLDRYKRAGFTAFQFQIDRALIKNLAGKEPINFSFQAFPYPAFEREIHSNQPPFRSSHCLRFVPLAVVLGFIFLVPSVMRGVVSEKQTGIKELMKMSGIPNWMHWFAWTINSLVFLSMSVTIVVFFFCVTWKKETGPLVSANFILVWFTLFFYVLASIMCCFFISSFFQKPALAITVGIIVWLITFFGPLDMLVSPARYRRLSFSRKMLMSLMPNVGVGWALKVLCDGVSTSQWDLFSPPIPNDNVALGHVWLMLLADAVLYFLLTLYLEPVLPSEFGVSRPWYFLCQGSFWRSDNIRALKRTGSEIDADSERPGFEKEPEGLPAGVVIRNLTKRFGRNKVAVDGVSLKMFDGQIFALLGHNGAGKTTTFSCCIGMTAPSSGTVIINGTNIHSNLDGARKQLGLCPQHNLLFDDLTVDEHLNFFGRLKGISPKEAKRERQEMLLKLQLSEKAKTPAGKLSGGQKRKLCLGISLIGKAKVVFLDEPTSGMDVQARRAIWDLLLGERGGRAIVLTTHFLEEADVLGDRIGIMAHGKVQCCGTPMFLKKYYGAGYTLSLTMAQTVEAAQKEAVLKCVQHHIPAATFKTDSDKNSNREFEIVLPIEDFSTSVLPAMFKELQVKKDTLGIETVGMSLTTMDEVFIKADHGAAPIHEDKSQIPNSEIKTPSDNKPEIPAPESEMVPENTSLNLEATENKRTLEVIQPSEDEGIAEQEQQPPRPRPARGCFLYFRQFQGLFIKKMMYSVRKWKMTLAMALIPAFLLTVSIYVNKVDEDEPPISKSRTMDLGSYQNPKAVYSFSNEAQSLGSNYQSLVKKFGEKLETNNTFTITDGLLQIGTKDIKKYREHYIVGADLSATNATALFSTIPYHASPLSLNLLTNAVLQSDPKTAGRRIKVTNHPLIVDFDHLRKAIQTQAPPINGDALAFGGLMPIGLALLAASFIVAPIEERMCKGKQLQFMTGVHPALYWGASFVVDFLLMIAVIIVVMICFPIFQTGQRYTAHGGFAVMFIVLLTYGFAAIPFSYLLSFVAKTVPGGFSLVTITHIVTGLILPIAVYFMEVIPDPDVDIALTVVLYVGRLFPTYGATICVMRFVDFAVVNGKCSVLPNDAEELLCDTTLRLGPVFRQCCKKCSSFEGDVCLKPLSYLRWNYTRIPLSFPPPFSVVVPGIGQELLWLFSLGIFYHLLLILLEVCLQIGIFGSNSKARNNQAFQESEQDEDVRLENERVHKLVRDGRVDEDALVVENLCKSYGSFAAVANLNFGVHHGECFGLLGVNGAGKTTSFRMLTGDETRTFGNAFLSGCTLQRSRKKFFGSIGYCPQFDGIIGVLTGLEMVQLFARLRGVKNVKKESEELLGRVSLLDSKNVQCRKYSGGMKRRLSSAMAMVGDPQIVFLDEPTSGVDPVSRREFWKIISSIKDSGRAIVLTSHSMDEITACCSRVGIMVNGQLQCIGTVQHLKNKFAQGYTLSLTLKGNFSADDAETETQELLNKLEQEVTDTFPPCSLKDRHQTAMQFQILNVALPWDFLFGKMEDIKSRYSSVIQDYSISETTLEEVFLAFARMQYPSRTTTSQGCCKSRRKSKSEKQKQPQQEQQEHQEPQQEPQEPQQAPVAVVQDRAPSSANTAAV